MDSTSSQQNQETLESILVSSKPHQDKKPRPLDQQSLKCPRCDSTNTKFCYYNNYSLSQPRYFCKSCRRYWTKGGTLRNVPVGGGCRKNKRGPSSSSSSSSSRRSQDQPMGTITPPTPIPCLVHPLSYDNNDLSLAIARLQKQGGLDDHDFGVWGNPNMPLSDVLGMNMNSSSGVFENHGPSGGGMNGLLYYGDMGMENVGMGIGGCHEMGGGGNPFQGFGTSTTTTTTTTRNTAMAAGVKQEICTGREGENRVLWGFPWQNLNGDVNVGEFESNRTLSWNGVGASHWHGLLNSPLM